MQRPIGVTLLAIGAGLVGIREIWRAMVFMGWVNLDLHRAGGFIYRTAMGPGDLGHDPGGDIGSGLRRASGMSAPTPGASATSLPSSR